MKPESESLECLKSFLDALIVKNEESVNANTQLTWLYRFPNMSIMEIMPTIKNYEIISESKVQNGDYNYVVNINSDLVTTVKVIREVAPYKPDPSGENGQWGVNPSSIINNLKGRV